MKKAQVDTAQAERALSTFIEHHVASLAPLERDFNNNYWNVATTGKKELYERMSALEVQIRTLHSDPAVYAFLQDLQNREVIREPALQRQLRLLVMAFAENQVEPELLQQMVTLSTDVERRFATFRSRLAGREVGDNDLLGVLQADLDPTVRQAAWEAYMAKGTAVRESLLALVKVRNQLARRRGFDNFYEMRLWQNEQNPEQIQALLEEMARKTDAPFSALYKRLERSLSDRFDLGVGGLQPWHFSDPFFQEVPLAPENRLDRFVKDRDPRSMVTNFFVSIGLDPRDILARSDLYEKPAKNPHAFCMFLDRDQDIRVLANLRPTEKWVGALMHETAHALYYQSIAPELPWLLRNHSHVFVSEAVAQLFGRQMLNPNFLVSAVGVSPEDARAWAPTLREHLRDRLLIFVRWALVMTAFERELYAHPDGDLDRLWWELKQRYQHQRAPAGRHAPDWAAKIHFSSSPVYYHNYLLGELFASQLAHVLAKRILHQADELFLELSGKPAVGQYLRSAIFSSGASLRWDDLARHATGENLNPSYFLEQFVAPQ